MEIQTRTLDDSQNFIEVTLKGRLDIQSSEAVKKELPELINDANAFATVLRELSPAQRTVVFEALEGRLPGFINNARTDTNISRHCYPGTSYCNNCQISCQESFKQRT